MISLIDYKISFFDILGEEINDAQHSTYVAIFLFSDMMKISIKSGAFIKFQLCLI